MGFVRTRSTDEFEMYAKRKAKYTTWTKNMSSIAGRMEVNSALAEFFFDSAPFRLDTDYIQRSVGEVESQVFSNFPIIRERASYEKECKVKDEKSLTFMCAKIFPSHTKLAPGLMILTCVCPITVVYGFSLMTSGESPQMIFDLVMSRFPSDYSPNIV